MKSRERLLNAIKGNEVDRIPWSPFLAYWWEHQSSTIRKIGEVELIKDFGADPLIRGHYPLVGDEEYEHLFLYEIVRNNCEIQETVKGNEKHVVYDTRVGSLTCTYKYLESSNTWFLHEHPVKTEEDFKILQFINENTVLYEKYDNYDKVNNIYKDDALVVPLVSPETKTCFQSMIEYWVGTEEMAYALVDFPEVVEETLGSMRAVSVKGAQICSESNAEVFISWEDSSSTNYSPMQYEKYILPEINEWCDILQKNGKIYIQHACGHLKDLLPCIGKSKIDSLESMSPPPTGDVELDLMRKELPRRIAMIGGIEPTHFLNYDMAQLEKYVIGILNDMKGTKFVLANSDSCPPGVDIEKFKLISQIVKRGEN